MNRIIMFISLCLLIACTWRIPDSFDLTGEWRFQTDVEDVGVDRQWYTSSLPDCIQLPGSMAENGKGDDISVSTPVLRMENWEFFSL